MASARVVDPDLIRSWRGVLDRYAEPRLGRSLLDLGTSVVPYLVLLTVMLFLLRVSVLLSLVLVLPASGFLIRVFMSSTTALMGRFCALGARTTCSARQ